MNPKEMQLSEPAPSWLQIRFGQLLLKFQEGEFSLTEAAETLDESKEVTNVVLSRLRQKGWLTVAFDEEDYRKRKYKLNNPVQVFEQIACWREKNA